MARGSAGPQTSHQAPLCSRGCRPAENLLVPARNQQLGPRSPAAEGRPASKARGLPIVGLARYVESHRLAWPGCQQRQKGARENPERMMEVRGCKGTNCQHDGETASEIASAATDHAGSPGTRCPCKKSDSKKACQFPVGNWHGGGSSDHSLNPSFFFQTALMIPNRQQLFAMISFVCRHLFRFRPVGM